MTVRLYELLGPTLVAGRRAARALPEGQRAVEGLAAAHTGADV